MKSYALLVIRDKTVNTMGTLVQTKAAISGSFKTIGPSSRQDKFAFPRISSRAAVWKTQWCSKHRSAARRQRLTINVTSERMTPIDPVSQTRLATLITYLYDKPCALCRIIYHSHRIANHFFYEADEDIPLDE
jgi:hypothetical protein